MIRIKIKKPLNESMESEGLDLKRERLIRILSSDKMSSYFTRKMSPEVIREMILKWPDEKVDVAYDRISGLFPENLQEARNRKGRPTPDQIRVIEHTIEDWIVGNGYGTVETVVEMPKQDMLNDYVYSWLADGAGTLEDLEKYLPGIREYAKKHGLDIYASYGDF